MPFTEKTPFSLHVFAMLHFPMKFIQRYPDRIDFFWHYNVRQTKTRCVISCFSSSLPLAVYQLNVIKAYIPVR